MPAGHVYVRHLEPVDGEASHRPVVRLSDPRPLGDVADQQQWWPPRMLDLDWVRRHHHEFDVFHVHFGFDACDPGELSRLVDLLARLGKPLVYTAHDLRNPHHQDRRAHDEHLDVLIPAAGEVITLTAGAADEIARRWGRRAVVVPHPHVVDLDTLGRRAVRPPRDEFRVGLHVKSLRPSMDPGAIVPTLLEAVEQVPGGVLQVNCHRDVLDPAGAHHDADLVAMLRGAGDRIDLRVHDFMSDHDLWSYLGSLDLSVLPYRFGTHSGWLEACRDLGTRVAAPTCGYFAEQGPVLPFCLDENWFEPATLIDAVLTAAARGPAEPVSVSDRVEQRRRVAQTHAQVYAGLVDGPVS